MRMLRTSDPKANLPRGTDNRLYGGRYHFRGWHGTDQSARPMMSFQKTGSDRRIVEPTRLTRADM